jgi:hypothetical protein
MSRKHIKLVLKGDADRSGARERVALPGTCRIGEGETQEVHVVDLSSAGCRVLGAAVGVTKGEALELSLGALGPFAGTLKWAKRGALGVAFDAPLDEAALVALHEMEPAPVVVPIKRAALGAG